MKFKEYYLLKENHNLYVFIDPTTNGIIHREKNKTKLNPMGIVTVGAHSPKQAILYLYKIMPELEPRFLEAIKMHDYVTKYNNNKPILSGDTGNVKLSKPELAVQLPLNI